MSRAIAHHTRTRERRNLRVFPVGSGGVDQHRTIHGAPAGPHSSGNANRMSLLIARVGNRHVLRSYAGAGPQPHRLRRGHVETVDRMFRRWSGATSDRRLRATATTAIRRSATVRSRSRALACATAGQSNRHHWASAATACQRSAQRGRAAALQSRPFPHRARRQCNRCEVCGRGTDACLR